MNTTTAATAHHSVVDRIRIAWAGTRYDFWLDVNSVPRRRRRELRTELKANLFEASDDVGVTSALRRVGHLRTLASETTRDGQLRSPWRAGCVAAAAMLTMTVLAFFVLMLSYTEGVLDSGADTAISSGLFPFFGSRITVDPSANGLSWSLETGPLPLIAAAAAFVLVAKPWRSLKGR